MKRDFHPHDFARLERAHAPRPALPVGSRVAQRLASERVPPAGHPAWRLVKRMARAFWAWC